jgi:hypothetical protein
MIVLNHRLAITVPSNIKGLLVTSEFHRDWKELVARELSTEFGGATCALADGVWVNDKGELIQEPVYVVESFFAAPLDNPNRAGTRLFKILQSLLIGLEQDCILVTLDGVAYLLFNRDDIEDFVKLLEGVK